MRKLVVMALSAIVMTGCLYNNKQAVVGDTVNWYENDSALWADLATANQERLSWTGVDDH